VSKNLFLAIAALCLAIAGCGGGSAPAGPDSEAVSIPKPRTGPVSTNKDDYPVFPDADAGADPSVPADQGGKGFTGKGWETNTDFDLIGDPHALKGGALRDALPDFPGTLRSEGPDSNTSFNYYVVGTAYESLLTVDPTTLDFIPSLATHWQISPDKMTYRFRINPNARFSDGTPVTADDVVASWDFRMDKTLESPSDVLTFGKFSRPVAESKYIVRVTAKELNWRNFLYFSGMAIFPAHVLKTLTGAQYLKDYNFKLLPGSGPYTISENDIDKGKSITARRRRDYWAEKARANVGLNNFDELRFAVVRDENLQFQMLKKGNLDIFPVGRARQWVEELNFDNIQRGLVQKRKIFNDMPLGVEGIALNMRKPPFNDLRVRKAFALLLDRSELIKKLLFNEYTPENSYFPGSEYENPANPKNTYNPDEALALLRQAGWTSRDSQGRLVKNGIPLEVELLYDAQTLEPILTVYQEDLRKVGISLNLRLITPETQFQILNERRFQTALMAWGALLFPNPETEWESSLADVNNTNDITGFKDPRVDALCKQYDKSFDVKERAQIIRKIDGILANAYPYVLFWTAPYTRIVYWDRFGTPPGYITRTGDYTSIYTMWWIDPDKYNKLQQALGNQSMKLDVGPSEDRYWLEYDKTHQSSGN
jgi:microcin C transport system substrate-binding protein